MKRAQYGNVLASTTSGTWFVGLFILAYFLANAGYSFLAFLAVVLGFLLLVGGMFSGGAMGAPRPAGTPIYGNSTMPSVIQIQPNWNGPVSGEKDVGLRLGSMANFFGSTIGYMMGGKPST